MKKKEAKRLLSQGEPPTVAYLQGCWRIEMCGLWRFMKLDIKVIAGNNGYNLYCLFGAHRWGEFSVRYGGDLFYKKSNIHDKIVKHPEEPGVMIGSFGWQRKRHKSTKVLAYFTMREI